LNGNLHKWIELGYPITKDNQITPYVADPETPEEDHDLYYCKTEEVFSQFEDVLDVVKSRPPNKMLVEGRGKDDVCKAPKLGRILNFIPTMIQISPLQLLTPLMELKESPEIKRIYEENGILFCYLIRNRN
jgi:hypothetical protein